MPEGGGFKRELTGPALGLLAVALVLTLAFTTELYRQIELKTLDMRFGLRPELQQTDLILHIDIDDSSISRWGRWPWPRDRHADLVRTCKELGAHEVIFDVEFPEPSSGEDDNAFAAGLHETGFSFLPFRLAHSQADSSGEEEVRQRIQGALLEHFDADAADLARQLNVPESAVDSELVGLKKSVARTVGRQLLEEKGELTLKMLLDKLLPKRKPFVESVEEKVIIPAAVDHCLALKRIYEISARLLPEGPQWERIPRTSEIEVPIDVLTRNAVGFGASNAPTDAEDGMLRHVSLFFVRKDRLLPHLSLVAACRALATDVRNVEVVPGSHITIHPQNDQAGSRQPIIVPVDEECRMIINWAGNRRTAWNNLFAHVPYGLVRGLNRFRENIADNQRVLAEIYRDNDQFVGGKWTRANQEVTALKAKGELSAEDRQRLETLQKEQQDVEKRIRDFLVKNTANEGQNEEERKLIAQMRYYLAGIDELRKEQERLRTNLRHVREQLESLIRGKLCIVGSTESASTDLKATPIHPLLPGVGVHSAVVNSILQRQFVRRAPDWVNVVAIAVVGLLVSLVASFLSTRGAAVGGLAVLVGWAVLTFLVFWLAGWWVAMAGPVMAGFLAYAAITAYRQLTEERQKRHIRNTFHHYLAPTVVAEVLKNPDALKLGGERKELTVFFSDVAG
ncbi:MAG TPA: CHASE2 domain-containing protein, partial [Planctomycetota bacterium]|nr:CHASE2 domain-containing protein [Planctomycetota bacterium]